MSSDSDNSSEKPKTIKKCVDLQRLKLEKLMKNIDKPIVIPERPKEKSLSHVPEFIRNVMGSSAGAGSGEFHVYRHLRRKEYARQKHIQLKSEKEMLDEAYKKKIEENQRIAEERTAKKRAKRLKKKQKMKNRNKKQKTNEKPEVKQETDSSEEEEEEEEKEEKEEKEEEEGKNGSKESENTDKNDDGSKKEDQKV